jgi:hypothetical protein
MIRVSSKTVIFSLLCVLASSLLSVCVPVPIDLEVFVNDDRVIKIIGIVDLTPDSEGKAGSGRITGLDPDKYYMIERWDKDTEGELDEDKNEIEFSDSTDIKFVSAGGKRVELIEIGRLEGTEITGLANNNLYRVKAAKLFPQNGTYYDVPEIPPVPASGTGKTAEISNGELILTPPTDKYYIDLRPVINAANYDMVKIPLPGGAPEPITASSGTNLISLEGENTKTDYVFAGKNENNNRTPNLFFVLNVTVQEQNKVEVNVTFSLVDGAATLSLDNTTVSKATLDDGGSLVITVTTALTNPSILIGTHTVAGNTITIALGGTPDIDDLLVAGAKIPLTVQGVSDGKTYSKQFLVTVVD